MTTYTEAYAQSINAPHEFWLQQAERIAWFTSPPQALTQQPNGLYRWFEGGKLNTCFLALDYQLQQGRADQTAIIYESPATGQQQHITYQALLDEVSTFAGVLTNLGVQKGDTVIIYMPMIPQTVVAMLACARLGAIHSVVFGGFAAKELAVRIDDARPKILLTANGGFEMDKIIHYLPIVHHALELSEHQPEHTVVYNRPQIHDEQRIPRHYLDWQECVATATPQSYTIVDATDPLYILYTSGTTGLPKGIVRDNGGHAVALHYSMQYIYGMNPGEVFWAASDVGWVVGHSYIVYAPLLYGCTTILYEGKPIRTPDAGAFWRIIAEHKVRTFFTAPTAIRAIKKEDPEGILLKKYDLSHLRYIFLAGERSDVATLAWLKALTEKPIIDHWWQTESGWPMIANMAGYDLHPFKFGSPTKPVCGFDIRVIDDEGNPMPPNEEGYVVIKYPLPPSCLPTLWQNDDNFIQSYLAKFEGFYNSGDGGYIDDEGYVYITGRIDDVINVAGHRLSTATLEEVIAGHPHVAECAVIGIADTLKGQLPIGFVVLKQGVHQTPESLFNDLNALVRNEVGAIACYKQTLIVDRLPKTRSGKILRKIMRFIADGKPYTMPSTIEVPEVLQEVTDKMRAEKVGIFINQS